MPLYRDPNGSEPNPTDGPLNTLGAEYGRAVARAVWDFEVSGPCFLASDLPQPTTEQRQAPRAAGEAGRLLERMGAKDDNGG